MTCIFLIGLNHNISSVLYVFLLFICTLTIRFYFFLLLLVPDVSMIGYFINTKIGAILYIVHHFSLPTILLTICIVFNISTVTPIALIWIAHILMDRGFGFGLKYANDFKETHLQKII